MFDKLYLVNGIGNKDYIYQYKWTVHATHVNGPLYPIALQFSQFCRSQFHPLHTQLWAVREDRSLLSQTTIFWHAMLLNLRGPVLLTIHKFPPNCHRNQFSLTSNIRIIILWNLAYVLTAWLSVHVKKLCGDQIDNIHIITYIISQHAQ